MKYFPGITTSKNKILFLLLFLFIGNQLSFCQPDNDSLNISILTCNPGNEVYSVFGHTAIRVIDYNNELDIVFNYGTFDFNTPNFYSKFVKGRLNYQLSISDFNNFKEDYILEQRSIFEQNLNLSNEGKTRMFNYLKTNYLPENRFYLYDFFLKNCTSVVRDIIKNNPENADYFKNSHLSSELSFRQHLHPLLKNKLWIRFGIDLLLGIPADKNTSIYESMFLPNNLMNQLDIIDFKGNKLVEKANVIYDGQNEAKNKTKILGPVPVFWFIFILLCFYGFFEFKKSIKSFLIDKIIFSIFGIFGYLLLFLWLGTDHWTMGKNMNLIWAIPFHFPLIIFLKRINKKIMYKYFLATAILSIILLIGWNLNPQEFHPAIVPVLLIIITRALICYYKLNKRSLAY
ncbi:DUF4105 domain-containing protein [Bacteroidota bacterium]